MILSSAYTGFEVRVSTPKGYEPDAEIVKAAEKAGAKIKFFESPKDAVKDSHVVYTDTWISMGSEDEKDTRLKAFFGYCVDSELLKNADKNAVVMHCLPAHRGEEISEDVMEGEQSVVWDQAENRLHAQKALLVKLLRK